MTPPAQPEYRTTDDDFDFIWNNINSPLVVRDRINLIKFRSRPAPSADAVLDELDRWAMAMTSIHDFAEKTDYGWRQSMEQLRDKIKALRVSDQLRQSRQHPNGKQDGERG